MHLNVPFLFLLFEYCVWFFKITPKNCFFFCFVLISDLKLVIKEPSFLGFNKFQRTVIHASDSTVNGALEVKPNQSSSVVVNGVEVEPFHGKSGSVSFYGLTHQSVEEGKLESAPFKQEEKSYFWVLAPVVFISSLILPQFFISTVVEAFFDDLILTGICDRILCFLLL
jgi:hypothetical protein